MALIMDEDQLTSFNETNDMRTYSFSEPDSLNMITALSVVYGIIFVTGILGNISTCIVIGCKRSMHTATNFYLFSLCISDLLLLICGLPFEVQRLWNPFSYPLGEELCITMSLISEVSAITIVLTITAFTVERAIHTGYIFRSQQLSTLSTTVRYITAIWICALCFAVPQAMQFGIVTYETNGQIVSECTVKDHDLYQFLVISSFVFFIVLMSLIIVLYVLIGIKMHTSRILQPVKKSSVGSVEGPTGSPHFRSGASQRRVSRMLVVVTIMFILCWTPFHVQRLIAIYGKNFEHPTDTFYKFYVVLMPLSGVLYYLSTSIKPFLYNIMSNKFRNAFRTLYVRNIPIVSEESKSWIWRERFAEGSDCLTSPQIISNSSLREINLELNCEELTTYLYEVNCEITGKIPESSI